MNDFFIPVNINICTLNEFQSDILKATEETSTLLFLSISNLKRFSLDHFVKDLSTISNLYIIDKIPQNPSIDDVTELLAKLKNIKVENIIAIGGGSCIDFAKLYIGLSYLIQKNTIDKNDLINCIETKDYLNYKNNINLYAVPTTSGTGSEVTRWATIWDFDDNKKYSVEADFLYPKSAYIIPSLTVHMPKRLTLSTGLDALCQAIEAYWSKQTNPIVRELSKISIQYIINNLNEAINDGSNMEYRKNMALGSLFSGLAFSNTKTTACHSISYPLTMLHNIEHGLACAMTLTKVFEYNINSIKELDKLFDSLKVKNLKELENWIRNVCKNITTLKLSKFDIKQSDLEKIADLSFTIGRMDNNPTEIAKDDVLKILLKCM